MVSIQVVSDLTAPYALPTAYATLKDCPGKCNDEVEIEALYIVCPAARVLGAVELCESSQYHWTSKERVSKPNSAMTKVRNRPEPVSTSSMTVGRSSKLH
jgi:hypothetical protein